MNRLPILKQVIYYDDNGLLDIYNYQMDNRPLHRWEWNGSKYIKVE